MPWQFEAPDAKITIEQGILPFTSVRTVRKNKVFTILLLATLSSLIAVIAVHYRNTLDVATTSHPGRRPVQRPSEPITKEVEYSLKKEEREYLWDLEHRGNLLNQFGFRHVIAALCDQDQRALLALFDDQFQGKVIQNDASSGLAIATEILDMSRAKTTSVSASNSNRKAFVDWLLELRREFADVPAPQGRFDIMTLSPPPADSPSGSWTASCIHRLWGQARRGGPLEVTLTLDVATHDLSKERLTQAGWLRACEVLQLDVGHAEQPLFQDVTADSGINPQAFNDNWEEQPGTINTGGLYSCDFNQDGYTDLFITDTRADGNRFYLGRPGGKFKHATLQVGLQGAQNTTIAAFADLDNDGWEDLILPRTGQVFQNDRGERFRDVTKQSNLGTLIQSLLAPMRYIAGVVIADYDRDGLIDLYVTRSVPPTGSWLDSKQPEMVANQLFRNQGNWLFFEVTRQTNTGGGGRSCFSAVWTDVNNDHWPDLYLINEFGNGELLVNHEGKSFESRMLATHQNDFGSMGLSCGDINNDGNVDIYVSNMYSKAGSRVMGNMKADSYPEEVKKRLRHMVAGGELYENQGDLSFKPVGKDYQVHAAGWAWGSSLADLNNDGWLDLHVTAGFMSRNREKPDG